MEKINEMNEIKLPKGVESIAVKQHDDKIVIEFIPEKPKFKQGDFVYEDGRIMIVKRYPNIYHANVWPIYSDKISYNRTYAVDFSESTFRYATAEEKQELIELLRKDGKRWNADKNCIEDIQKRKFKAGDKVKIKDGISSKTHGNATPHFTEFMDKYIGKELTVKEYSNVGSVLFNEDYFEYYFAEDWLEPWSEELKDGDLAIFWNDDKTYAVIRLYGGKSREYYYDHCDNSGSHWKNAIKFEFKEQFEKVLRGEI